MATTQQTQQTQQQAPSPRRRPARTVAAVAAAALLAGTTAVTAFRIADADGPTPVPQLLAFLPWLAVPAGLGLLGALLARRRVLAVWGTALLALLAWHSVPRGGDHDPAGAPVADLRVLTANLQFGQAVGPLVDLVRQERPDLVFVQECDPACMDTLTSALSATHPHRRAVAGGGPVGSVIHSRLPLTPAAGVPASMGQPGAVTEVAGHQVRLQLAHPSPPIPERLTTWRTELGDLRRWARERAAAGNAEAAAEDTPVILAGDFNASRDHAAFRRLLDDGRLHDAAALAGAARASTWPVTGAPLPGVQIDHVLVSPAFTARDARFPEMEGSDHRAVLVTLTLHR
ncbi:endonuclease/exonuclease/phosphatase family protein [Streptomyces sp. NPDC002640]